MSLAAASFRGRGRFCILSIPLFGFGDMASARAGREVGMKIAVEITIFGHRFSEVVEYPGVPRNQADVVRWMMTQTEFKWVDYDHATTEDKLLFALDEDVVQ